MSSSARNWLGRFFKKSPQPGQERAPEVSPIQNQLPPPLPGYPYQKGDVIDQEYTILETLGKGGFGVVYLVHSRKSDQFYALKTFQDEFLADREVRQRFHKEASVWVELGRHPYLVRAQGVGNASGRLYIVMEFIAPNEEGLNAMGDYLLRRPPDLAQSLRWAIQICHGMEYAYSRGVRAHRDLKPANIMITQDKTAKITDFGLAGMAGEQPEMRAEIPGALAGMHGSPRQTMIGAGFGTPTHMAPEQFDNAAGCDERSDIYSFGIVLYQMAARRVPFSAPVDANFWQAMSRLHQEASVPRLDSPLFSVIQRCLEKQAEKRYQTFKEAREDLALLLQHLNGEEIHPPPMKETEAWEWINKAYCLANLGNYQAALPCCDRALELQPRNSVMWNNKGGILVSLGGHEDALRCFDRALELNPDDAYTWANKSANLDRLGRHEEASDCLDKAMQLDPSNAGIRYNSGVHLLGRGRFKEAISFFDQTLQLDPRHNGAWANRGTCYFHLGRYEEALLNYDQALQLDPLKTEAWENKGNSYLVLKNHAAAMECFDKLLEIDPHSVAAWSKKGSIFASLDNDEEAVRCYQRALVWDPQNAAAWMGKALSEDQLGRWQEAAQSYKKFLALASAQFSDLIEFARQRLLELGKDST